MRMFLGPPGSYNKEHCGRVTIALSLSCWTMKSIIWYKILLPPSGPRHWWRHPHQSDGVPSRDWHAGHPGKLQEALREVFVLFHQGRHFRRLQEGPTHPLWRRWLKQTQDRDFLTLGCCFFLTSFFCTAINIISNAYFQLKRLQLPPLIQPVLLSSIISHFDALNLFFQSF